MLVLAANISFAQNLVSNPGFESYSALPNGAGQYNLAMGWGNCLGGGSPDYFSTLGSGLVQLPNCFVGNVSAHSGDGCMGAALYYYSPPDFREYLSSQLISPLVPGQAYQVNFYVTNGITSGTYGGGGIDMISAAFSTQPLTQSGSGPIPVVPQVTYGTIFYSYTWQFISMQFVADSAYQYITIGNFADDASTAYQQFDPCPNFGAYIFFDDIEVTVANQTPVALFTASNHICPGTCTDFTNLSQQATSYQWTFSGANPSVSTDTDPATICYTTPGNYDVQLIATNATTSDTLLLANYITVYPFPAPQGIIQTGDTLIANQGAVSYQWYLAGTAIPGATEYFYVASEGGNYSVVAVDANGCEVEAVVFDVVAGIHPSVSGPGVSIELFPNPVTDILNIQYGKGEVTAMLSVYNMLGETVFNSKEKNPPVVDCKSFPSGLYILEAVYPGKIIRKTFTK